MKIIFFLKMLLDVALGGWNLNLPFALALKEILL